MKICKKCKEFLYPGEDNQCTCDEPDPQDYAEWKKEQSKITWHKCPKCRCKIKTVFCENCGEEIEIGGITEFKDKQLNVKEEFFTTKFYSKEYENIRYYAHLDRAFDNPNLQGLCELVLNCKSKEIIV